MIARPVRLQSDCDAFYIVAADGAVVADCIPREEWAREIVEALNNKVKQ